MNFMKRRLRNSGKTPYAIAKEIGVKEERIKEVIDGKRRLDKDRFDKFITATQVNKDTGKTFEYQQMLMWFNNTDIKALRKDFGYTLKEISEELNINVTSYCKIENRDRKPGKYLQTIYDFYNDTINKKVDTTDKPTTSGKKRGRPRKNAVVEDVVEVVEETPVVENNVNEVVEVVEETPVVETKKKRGRPRKNVETNIVVEPTEVEPIENDIVYFEEPIEEVVEETPVVENKIGGNKITQLQDIIFDEITRLNNAKDNCASEIKRSDAIARQANTFVKVVNTNIKVNTLINKKNDNLVKDLGLED